MSTNDTKQPLEKKRRNMVSIFPVGKQPHSSIKLQKKIIIPNTFQVAWYKLISLWYPQKVWGGKDCPFCMNYNSSRPYPTPSARMATRKSIDQGKDTAFKEYIKGAAFLRI